MIIHGTPNLSVTIPKRTRFQVSPIGIWTAGHGVRFIAAVLFCSFDLIASVRHDYQRGGVAAVLGDERVIRRIPWWYGSILRWLTEFTPVDFGLRRSRWSCEALARVLSEHVGVTLGREGVRCVLREMGFVWRRPRPIVGPADPDHEEKMRAIRELLAHRPTNEVAVFQDEVQLDLNPKIGSAWMLEGVQQEVVTPGDNVRRHLAVSMLVCSGHLVVSEPTTRRNSAQFIAHLADLCRRLRHWAVIHVICDNAAFHKSAVVRRWVAGRNGRVVLHYLPSRAGRESGGAGVLAPARGRHPQPPVPIDRGTGRGRDRLVGGGRRGPTTD
jgi:transposase